MDQRYKDIHRQVIISMVAKFFDWNQEKAALWMELKNPHLDDISPDGLIELDKIEELYEFVETSLEENEGK